MSAYSRYLFVILASFITLFAAQCSGNSNPVCGPLGEEPGVDWAQINDLVTKAFDVSTTSLTAADLQEKYATGDVEVQVRQIETTGDRYMLLLDRAARKQTIVVPGTNLEDTKDILADMDMLMEDDPELGASFDEGFLGDARDVRADVTTLLESDYPTTVVGYSLGGAIAAILSMYLEHDGFILEQIVTFGQPKVTNAAGAQKFADLPILRFKAAEDAVPELPPFYHHFGKLVTLLDGPYYVYMTMADPNFNTATSLLRDLDIDDISLDDHGTYPQRADSKLPGPNNQVSYCDRRQYIEGQ